MKYIKVNNTQICIDNKPIRKLQDKEVLIKTKYVWLCWSDLHKIKNKAFSQIVTLWHEIVWKVIDARNSNLIGKTVAINPLICCGSCIFCRNNNSQFCVEWHSLGKDIDWWFSEFVIAPENNIYPLEESFNPKLWILIDGMAVVLHSLSLLKKHTKINKLSDIAIIWDGTIGMLIAILLKKIGIKSVTIFGKKNINKIVKLGFSGKVFSDIEKTPTEKYDVIFDCVWRAQSSILNQSVRTIKKQWLIMVLWVYPIDYFLPLNVRNLFYKEVILLGSNSFSSKKNLSDFCLAYKFIHKHQKDFLKILGNSYHIDDFEIGVKSENNYFKTFFYFD